MLSGSVGGSGVTTYAENIGVMAVTKVYSTLVFVAAAVMAMLLGFTKIWCADPHHSLAGHRRRIDCGVRVDCRRSAHLVQHRVDPARTVTRLWWRSRWCWVQVILPLTLGGFTVGGIGTATFGAILLNALLSRRKGMKRKGSHHLHLI